MWRVPLPAPLSMRVTLTGSEAAGREVASHAGQHLKKCVLELGGSDAFIVLKDADLELAATFAVRSRFQNCGQSCIAAKRIIPVAEIADEFLSLFIKKAADLKMGDPMSETTQLGPMARLDLREDLHQQVADSIAQGARAGSRMRTHCRERAHFIRHRYSDRVTAKTRAYHEELFGPVAAVIRAANEEEAIHIANDTRFGLGSSIWSRDSEHAEEARATNSGRVAASSMAWFRSDPRLPFGGIKASGFGRELSYHGIREFVNIKTVWIR